MGDYEGWKNRQTWNVALWLNNDKSSYTGMVEYVKTQIKEGKTPTYRGCIKYLGLSMGSTPDGIAWNGSRLDLKALNEMTREALE